MYIFKQLIHCELKIHFLFLFLATQRVVTIPPGTKEVTITSTKKQISTQEVVPCFLQPLQPEIKVLEKSVARSVGLFYIYIKLSI